MKQYKYKAMSQSGVTVSGVIEANSKFSAIDQIKTNCPVVLEIEEISSADISDLFESKKIKTKELALMCKQFSIILTAGLPLVKSTELIADQVEDKVLKKVLKDVAADVSSGIPLSDSFEKNAPSLPPAFIETVRAGEQSGKLDVTFEQLSKYFEKQNKTKSRVSSALVYPAIVLSVAVIVVIIIMVFAIPVFSKTLTESGVELPVFTRILIAVSNFFKNNIIVILAVIAAIVLFCLIWKKTESGKKFFANLQLSIPIIGKINQMNNSAFFANTMSTLNTAGLTMVRATHITGKTMPNYVMGLDVQKAANGVETGRRLSDCLRASENIPPLLTEMVGVGEESGSLEDTMNVIADYYENETDIATAKMLAAIEPAMIIFLAVIVVVILLAVYMPMFSMYGSIS